VATAKQQLDMEALEAMVDRHGMQGMLSMLAEICSEKAAHIIENWQDSSTAQWWEKRSAHLEAVATMPFMSDD
jgi:hypothetical protein